MEQAAEVTDNEEARRYEITVDGRLAGFVRYRRRPGQLVFTHTEIDEEFEGQGLGGRLVGAALGAARDAGVTVVPVCPFVAKYVERHPEYRDVIAEEPGDA
ncbi:GNAT family N-acetyltransferase [Sphaerisporangium rubeum]|uniref:Putative GNAT family acetyltransferase n=1 Tax=Sphaerisporangium rubeum TaxID=321317 RepID=A0A7X0IJJ1_9ACTN|nr:putative GNAT family acetyltransferase [Sphaerisporangium rubeum]